MKRTRLFDSHHLFSIAQIAEVYAAQTWCHRDNHVATHPQILMLKHVFYELSALLNM